jgi:uncharacterized cupredoxin-like copper-binding protein
VTAVVIALVSAACGTKPAGPRPTPAAVVVPVTLGDLAIEPRRLKLKAGKVQFQVTNRGTVDRDFQIPTLETHHGHEQHLLKPGETKTLEYDLTPGTHEVVCTTPGRQEAGMTASLEVFP